MNIAEKVKKILKEHPKPNGICGRGLTREELIEREQKRPEHERQIEDIKRRCGYTGLLFTQPSPEIRRKYILVY